MTEVSRIAADVEQVAVAAELRELSQLPRVDYEDAFLVDPADPERSPADWARATIGDAPAGLRRALLTGWSSLGLRLGAGVGPQVLGWRLRRADQEAAVLAADSPLGIAAELVFRPLPGALLFATFVRLEGEGARAAWAEIEPFHPAMVRRLLEGAASPPVGLRGPDGGPEVRSG